jgi:hypothetical protein
VALASLARGRAPGSERRRSLALETGLALLNPGLGMGLGFCGARLACARPAAGSERRRSRVVETGLALLNPGLGIGLGFCGARFACARPGAGVRAAPVPGWWKRASRCSARDRGWELGFCGARFAARGRRPGQSGAGPGRWKRASRCLARSWGFR